MDKKDKQIDELKKQVTDLTNNWKRALADYQNLEKRVAAQKEEWVAFSAKNLILKLLPVLDNLEKACTHLNDEGLNLAVNHFKTVLKEEGVEEIKALGELFDPVYHESIEMENGSEDNKITEIFNKGYKLNGKLIRPAKVKVSKKIN